MARRRFLMAWLAGLLALLASDRVWALSPADLVQLKEAGLSEATIEAVVRERAVETAAFQVEDLLRLRRAGIGDATIRLLVEQGSFRRRPPVIVYGASTRPLRLVSVDDLLRLKAAGFDDTVLALVVTAAADGGESPRAREALEMLREMDLEILVPARP